jgi:hypothetical protein
MASRSARSARKGVGSLMDVGGTSYKARPINVVIRGGLSSDQRAIGKDFRVAITKVVGKPAAPKVK